MKTLTLIRHAKSSWKREGAADLKRPLSTRGKTDAILMGLLLLKNGILPQLIISSPAMRAFKTAEIIAGQCDYPVTKIRRYDELYMASPEDMLAVLGSLKDKYTHVFLCGHNPGITGLLHTLIATETGDIPTCGIACVEVDTSAWDSLASSPAVLKHYDFPKKHY